MGFDVLSFDFGHLAFDGPILEGHRFILLVAQTGPSGDQFAGDDVLLQAMEIISLGLDGGVGEDSGGFLEGSRGEEALGFEGGLGDAEQDRFGDRRAFAGEERLLVLIGEAIDRDLVAWEQRGVATIDDNDFAEHLADDDLQVLIGDADLLGGVDLLDLFDHVDFDFLDVAHIQEFFRVDRAFGDLGAVLDFIADLDAETRAIGGGVEDFLVIVLDGDDIAVLLRLDLGDGAGDFADLRFAFGVTGFALYIVFFLGS